MKQNMETAQAVSDLMYKLAHTVRLTSGVNPFTLVHTVTAPAAGSQAAGCSSFLHRRLHDSDSHAFSIWL